MSVCLANPGMPETHLVQSIDDVPAMSAVLVSVPPPVIARMRVTSTLTLLHLEPCSANGMAKLHNAPPGRDAGLQRSE